GKIRNVDATLRPTQRRRQRYKQHRRKIMPCIDVPRIANFSENRDQCFHPGPPTQQRKPLQNPLSPSTQQMVTHMRFPCPCGGGLGWGVWVEPPNDRICGPPPTPARPRQGGGGSEADKEPRLTSGRGAPGAGSICDRPAARGEGDFLRRSAGER